VDETPKGWFIVYIDRDPETIARQKALERRCKADVDEEERERLRIEKQLEEARRRREEMGITDGEREEDISAEAEGDTTEVKDDEDNTTEEKGEKESDMVKLEGIKKIAFSLGGTKKPLPLAKQEGPDHDAVVEGGDGIVMASNGSETTHRKRKQRESPDRKEERSHSRDDDQSERDAKRSRSSKCERSSSTSPPPTISTSSATLPSERKRPLTAVEEIMLQEEKRKQRERERREQEQKKKQKLESQDKHKSEKRLDYWLAEGIVVKVKHKTVGGGKYYNQKGVVEQVDGRYVAQIKMSQSGDVLRLDQDFLETVLPALEGRVRVVNGKYRGARAILKAIDIDQYCATIELADTGELVQHKVPYEDIAKIAD